MFSAIPSFKRWTSCYIALWPVLIVGYAAYDDEDTYFVGHILDAMRSSMGYGEVQRVHDELNYCWSSRKSRLERVDSLVTFAGA